MLINVPYRIMRTAKLWAISIQRCDKRFAISTLSMELFRSTSPRSRSLISGKPGKHFLSNMHSHDESWLVHGHLSDRCASGGFTLHVLLQNRVSQGVGVTFPTEEGGYQWGLSHTFDDRFKLVWHNLLAYNLAPPDARLPAEHPAFPYFDRTFNLVILGGSHLRTQVPNDYTRASSDHSRLEFGQLQVGLRCVEQGGTIIMKLAKAELEETARVLYILDQVAEEVHTHKPRHIHATRSSYYVIAKGIRRGKVLDEYVSALQALWYDLTYGGENANGVWIPRVSTLGDTVPWNALTSDENLDRLIQLGSGVWEVQLMALTEQNERYKHTERPLGAPDIRGNRRRGQQHWKSRVNA